MGLGRTSAGRGRRWRATPTPQTSSSRKTWKLTKPTITEDQLARTVASLLETVILPPALFTHFPAGGGKLTAASAGRLKGYGLAPGMPDYLVFFNKRVIGIELKREGGALSAAQKAMHPRLYAAGCPVYVCKTLEQVIEYLNIERVPMRQNFVEAILKKDGKDEIDTRAAESGEAQS